MDCGGGCGACATFGRHRLRNDLTAAGAGGSAIDRWARTLYFIVGQAGWFACVISAAHGLAWFGIATVVVLIAAHLWRVARPLEELKLLVTVAVIGAVWESVEVLANVLGYPAGSGFHGLAPLWIVALWALFAAQFNTTYQWLKTRMPLAALLGAVAGPLSFRAGAALGAVRFVHPPGSVAVVAAGWAVLLPGVVLLARRWNGVSA